MRGHHRSVLMDKHLTSEESRGEEARPLCCVAPHQQLLLREYAENDEEEEGVSVTYESDVSSRRRKTALVRSKTLDPALLIQSDSELKCERRKPQSYQFLRTNSQYHKVFKDIRKDEELRQSYTCALQKDILYQGRLFVSDNWICFHSKVFGRDTKIAIPVTSVTVLKKTNTAILVPNALVISTAHERHVFVSFLSRDATYKVLMSVCPHLVEESPGFSQIPAQSLRRQDFSVDLSDLQHHSDDSSASESPEFDKSPDFCSKLTDVDSAPQQADTHLTCGGSAEVTNTQRFSFNTLVFIYLSLVCVLLLSSCFMAFKIVSLEERLTSLVSIDFPQKGDEYHSLYVADTDEVYSVISSSLLKLEKVHRNLQKLLETLSDV